MSVPSCILWPKNHIQLSDHGLVYNFSRRYNHLGGRWLVCSGKKETEIHRRRVQTGHLLFLIFFPLLSIYQQRKKLFFKSYNPCD